MCKLKKKQKMSLLSHLQFQTTDDSSENTPFVHGKNTKDDEIDLKEQIDENQLETSWNKIVEDLEKDPDWFTFADE